MEDDLLLLCSVTLCAAALYILNSNKKKKRKPREVKTRLINRDRKKCGFYNVYFKNMKENDAVKFFKYTRMNSNQFSCILNGVTPIIKKQKTKDGICPEERLALTLHYLSQGCSMQFLARKYHMGLTTVHKIIHETCNALATFLSPNYLKPPSTPAEWFKIADDFSKQCNFPNCIGALDGKHIPIQAPGKTGNQFSDKKQFSVVLLACCDANHIFRLIDIGAYGSCNDDGIFKQSSVGETLNEDLQNVPPPSQIPNTNIMQPYVIVADEAFPLKSYIMRPYLGKNLSDNQRIFNCRLSRARRCIENAFGIVTNRWKLLRTTIVADVKNIDSFIKAIVCLHNFLRSEQIIAGDNSYCPPGFLDEEFDQGNWRNGVTPLQSVGRLSANRASQQDVAIRDTLADYFMSDVGSVPWQYQVLTDGFV